MEAKDLDRERAKRGTRLEKKRNEAARSRPRDLRVCSKAASRNVRVEVKANETATLKLRALSVYHLSRSASS